MLCMSVSHVLHLRCVRFVLGADDSTCTRAYHSSRAAAVGAVTCMLHNATAGTSDERTRLMIQLPSEHTSLRYNLL
jgi:hypothetical protein